MAKQGSSDERNKSDHRGSNLLIPDSGPDIDYPQPSKSSLTLYLNQNIANGGDVTEGNESGSQRVLPHL